MSDSQGILLFTTDSAAGSASSDYDKDVFQDVSLPATNNTGLTSTVSTNPLNGFFANDAAPRWMAKTLFIKDLQRVEDRTLWVNGRATYKIIWSEDFPGADGYVFGSVALGGTGESRYVSINDLGDGCGVTGVIRRVQWLVRPQSGTATATPALDGSNLSNIDFGGYTGVGTVTKPFFEAFTTDTSNASYDLHDHRLTANQINKLQILGVVVYYNVSGDGLDLPGGSVYVDKSKTTLTGSTLAYPGGFSNFLGGWDGVFTNSNGVFGFTISPVSNPSAPCSGAIDTNLISVQIGSGASFPIGSGIYVPNGSTYYLGQVTNVSGDVLTVSPTLPFGLSNVCTSIFRAGTSFVISSDYFDPAFSYQPGIANRALGTSLIAETAPWSFSDPFLRYRAWGSTLQLIPGSSLTTGLGASQGLRFPSAADYLQFDGRFSALEFEYLIGQSAILAATYLVDGGIATVGTSTALDGPTVLRQTVLSNAGLGWHSVLARCGGSTNVLLSRITAYEPKVYNGPSYGMLAQVSIGQTFTLRNAQNATLMAFGNISRIYAETLRANGASWITTAEAGPGGRSVSTTNTDDYVEFQYFGTRFALLGSAGTSTIMQINGGAATTPMFNAWSYPEATLGFQTVKVQSKAGTLKLFGYDYLSTVGEVRNKQLFDPVANLSITPRVFTQTSEPEGARAGDIWQVGISAPIAYMRIFGGWQQFQPFNPPIGSSLISTITRTNMYGASQIISSTGATTTGSVSYVDCTGGATLITTGRPVIVMLAPASENAFISNAGQNILGQVRVLRDGATSIGGVQVSNGAAGGISGNGCFTTIDAVSAGTHSWKGQVSTSNGTADASASNLKIVAFEL